MVDYRKGEALYREFIEFRCAFLNDANEKAAHVNTTSDGRTVRPVVIVPYKKAAEVEKQINRWRELVEELDNYPDLKIPKTLTHPIPKMLNGVRFAAAYDSEAVNSRNVTAEHLIKLIEKDLRINKKGNPGAANDAYIDNLEAAKAKLSELPAGEPMRMRIHGYRETVLNLYFISSSPLHNSGDRVTMHVPICGMYINDEAMRDGFRDESTRKQQGWSAYDEIEPITCSRWPTAKIYRTADVEAVKASRDKANGATEFKSADGTPKKRKKSEKIKDAFPESGQ